MSALGVAVLFGASAQAPSRVASAETAAGTAPEVASSPAPVPNDLIVAQPGGLTARAAGALARQASLHGQVLRHDYEAGVARVDQARSALLPRMSVQGSWRHIGAPPEAPSNFPQAQVVLTEAPNGTPNPAPTVAYHVDLTFPARLDQYLVEAVVELPITEYFTRLIRELRAASATARAAQLELENGEARAESQGRLLFYDWIRARGLQVLAVQSLNDRRARLKEARDLWATGQGNAADLRLAEVNALAAELEVERTRAHTALLGRQLQITIGADPGAPLILGEGLAEMNAAPPAEVSRLVDLALDKRLELRVLDERILEEGERERGTVADQLPSLTAGANLIYANPSPLRAAQVDAWTLGWTAGLSLRWSPDKVVAAGAARREHASRRRAMEAEKAEMSRSIELEVMGAREELVMSLLSLGIAGRQLEAAQQAHRLASDQFRNGLRDSATLISGEESLMQARLTLLQSRIDTLTARVRLASAVGIVPEDLP